MEKGRGVGASAEQDPSEVNVTVFMTRPAPRTHEDNLGDPRPVVGVVLFRQGGTAPAMLVEVPLLRALSRTKKYPSKSPPPRGANISLEPNAVGAPLLRREVQGCMDPV